MHLFCFSSFPPSHARACSRGIPTCTDDISACRTLGSNDSTSEGWAEPTGPCPHFPFVSAAARSEGEIRKEEANGKRRGDQNSLWSVKYEDKESMNAWEETEAGEAGRQSHGWRMKERGKWVSPYPAIPTSNMWLP